MAYHGVPQHGGHPHSHGPPPAYTPYGTEQYQYPHSSHFEGGGYAGQYYYGDQYEGHGSGGYYNNGNHGGNRYTNQNNYYSNKGYTGREYRGVQPHQQRHHQHHSGPPQRRYKKHFDPSYKHEQKHTNFDSYRRGAFLPPGADTARNNHVTFSRAFQHPLKCSKRLQNKPSALIEAVNDFHFSMLNDIPRNEFYLKSLQEVITPESVVVEIGTGTGLLAMLAAKCGAKKVYAIEANKDLASVARDNIAKNNLSDTITVFNKLSFEFSEADFEAGMRPNVVLSEVFGTLLLGESAHVYISDLVQRVCAPNTAVVPRFGIQYATLVMAEELERFTSVASWNGIDLSTLNQFKDTSSVVFTRSYGFRFSSMKHEEVADPIPVVEIDFTNCDVTKMPSQKQFRVRCKKSGTVHCVLLFWESWQGESKTPLMSTHPVANLENPCRDLQWGQAMQLVEDESATGDQPQPLVVKEGDELDVTVVFSKDGVMMQYTIAHANSQDQPSPPEATGN